MPGRPLTAQALIAAQQTVLTGRGQIPVEQVRVGDCALSGAGRWAPVVAVWRVLYRGPMASLRLEGQSRPICVTLNQRVAIGPNLWERAERLRLGTVVAVPLLQLPAVPPAEDLFVAWLDITTHRRRHRLYLHSPWGRFCAEEAATGGVYQPGLLGSLRITPEGLVRLGGRAGGTGGTWDQLPEVFYRLDQAQWCRQENAPTQSTQSTVCQRVADRILLGRTLHAGTDNCVAIPRRVVAFVCGDYTGPAYSITVDGASSLVVSGLLARHGGHTETADWSVQGKQ